MRLIGLFVVIGFVEFIVLAISTALGNTFLANFIYEQSLQIMGTLLGLNVATASFILGHLTSLEVTLKQGKLFDGSRTQIRHNVLFMLVIFLLHVCVLLWAPENNAPLLSYSGIDLHAEHIGFYFFLLYMFALYELSKAIFMIDSLTSETKPNTGKAGAKDN